MVFLMLIHDMWDNYVQYQCLENAQINKNQDLSELNLMTVEFCVMGTIVLENLSNRCS